MASRRSPAALFALTASVAWSCGCGTVKDVERDFEASCSDLSTFQDVTLGCIDVPQASLGEIIAASVDGSKPPKKLGAVALTQPAPAGVLARASTSCIDVLTTPVLEEPGLHHRHSFELPAFKSDVGAVSAELGLDVRDRTFYLDVGELTLLSLQDPVRSLNCSIEAIAVVAQYWSALSASDRPKATFYVVDQVALTNRVSIQTSTGDSLSATFDKRKLLDVDYSVSYDCSEIAGLPDDAGVTAIFMDVYPNALTFDGTTFSVSDRPVACGDVVGASP